jgi:hypothetical protein
MEAEIRGVDDRLDYVHSITIDKTDSAHWRGQARKGEVIISENLYLSGDSAAIEYVLVHELGHAAFGYSHNKWFMQIDGFGSHREGFYNAFFEEHNQGGN